LETEDVSRRVVFRRFDGVVFGIVLTGPTLTEVVEFGRNKPANGRKFQSKPEQKITKMHQVQLLMSRESF
jgi:hypothetical protein